MFVDVICHVVLYLRLVGLVHLAYYNQTKSWFEKPIDKHDW